MKFIDNIWNIDCIKGMKRMHDLSGECVDLVITSPPYNIGKSYETKKSIEQYLEWSEEYLYSIYRVLKSGHSLFFEIGCYVDEYSNNIPLAYLLYPIIKKVGFCLKQEIVWYFKGGMQAKNKLTGQNEKILWLYKGENNPYFNLDSIRVKEWATFDKRNNPNGKNPTDVWEINRVPGNSTEKVAGHPCQFPISLPDRIIKGWSMPNDIILDPFSGSGTVAVAAIKNRRRFVGFEINVPYYDGSLERIKNAYKEVCHV